MRNTTLCYIEQESDYLMMHRVKKKNDVNQDKWVGAGGKFEADESPEECLLREVFEETGLTENLRIIDNISTVEDICDYITREKLDLAVVDYVQIVETLKKEDTVRTKIDYISGRLKQAAKRSRCRVILLSQLKRPESGIVKPPTMNDLKESSGLEQDGDYIIMLYRPYVQDKSFTEAGGYKYKPYESAALLEKNKFGFIGECKLFFDGAHQDFREAT